MPVCFLVQSSWKYGKGVLLEGTSAAEASSEWWLVGSIRDLSYGLLRDGGPTGFIDLNSSNILIILHFSCESTISDLKFIIRSLKITRAMTTSTFSLKGSSRGRGVAVKLMWEIFVGFVFYS